MEKLKDIDRKIFLGAALTVGFLILWLVTSPSIMTNSKTNTSPTVDEIKQQNDDIDSYNRAKIMNNNLYCEDVQDKDLKESCFADVTTRAEPEPVVQVSEQESLDIDAYNRAKIMKKAIYCEDIQNPDLKAQCMSELTGK